MSFFCLLTWLDTNEDGVLDEQELEALFTKEVQPLVTFTQKPEKLDLAEMSRNIFTHRQRQKKMVSLQT